MDYDKESETILASEKPSRSAKDKDLQDVSSCLALLWAVEHSKNPQQVVTITYVKNWLLSKSKQIL